VPGSVTGSVASSVSGCLLFVVRLGGVVRVAYLRSVVFWSGWQFILNGSADLELSLGVFAFFYSGFAVFLLDFFSCSGFDVCL
jgi:hypothetical protein